MSDGNDLETLTDGLSSPFWAWFSAHVTKEWGPSGLRYQQAVRDAAKSAEAVLELQKVLHTQEAILLLMQAPRERLAGLQNERKVALRLTTSQSRRGPGL